MNLYDIPQGALTQICGAPLHINQPYITGRLFPGSKKDDLDDEAEASLGRTTLILSLLAQLTSREHFCALVDVGNYFDPVSAEDAGVDLRRLLWVRCREKSRLKPLEQAFKATDILVQNGGFGLIAVDLTGIEPRYVRKVPLTTWFRFARVVEKMPTALVFMTNYPAAQSCAGLTLHMKCASPLWARVQAAKEHGKAGKIDKQFGDSIKAEAQKAIRKQFEPSDATEGEGNSGILAERHTSILYEMDFEVEIGRDRLRKPVQPARSQFAAKAVWS